MGTKRDGTQIVTPFKKAEDAYTIYDEATVGVTTFKHLNVVEVRPLSTTMKILTDTATSVAADILPCPYHLIAASASANSLSPLHPCC